VNGGMFVQVTSSSVRLVDANTYSFYSEFSTNKSITVATGNYSQLIIALSGGEIIYLELDIASHSYKVITSTILDQDVACVSFCGFLQVKSQQHQQQQQQKKKKENASSTSSSSSSSSSSSHMDIEVEMTDHYDHSASISNLLAIGMWTDNSIRLLTLPTLEEVVRTTLATDTQARDLLLASFEEKFFLFIGMGDGNLISYNIELANGLPTITNRRKGVLGTHPITFTPFYSSTNELCIFASCDRPTVIYMRNHKLIFSIMNIKNINEITEMTQFHSELFPDCLTLCSESQLLIGTVEDIQKIHIQSIPLNEAPRRISHCSMNNIYAGKSLFV
jgi:DNA damage-binding protein 1